MYQFALLVCDRNRMLQAYLRRFGFITDSHSISLPGGDPNDQWTFLFVGPDGPIRRLDDQLPNTNPLALSKYLTFGSLTPVVTDVLQPASVTVHVNELEQFDENARFGLHGVRFVNPTNGWRLQFADNPNTTDQTSVAFNFPIHSSLPGTDPNQTEFQFDLSTRLLAIADGGNWGGSKLQVKEFDLEGGPDDRFPLGGGTLVTTTNGGEDPEGALLFEWQPATDLVFPMLKSSMFRIRFMVQSLRVRFDAESVGVYLPDNFSGSPSIVKLSLEIPLIMAPLADAIPEALAVVIPLTDRGTGGTKLSWAVAFSLDDSWETNASPLVNFEDRWTFSDELMNVEVPFDFLDETEPLDLGGLQFSIAELVGDILGDVNFGLGPKTQSKGTRAIRLENGRIVVTINFDVTIGGQRLRLELDLVFNLKTLRLDRNRLEFRFPVGLEGGPGQLLDLGAFAILLPYRDPDSDEVNGYIDFEKREFVLKGGDTAYYLVVPGGLKPRAYSRGGSTFVRL